MRINLLSVHPLLTIIMSKEIYGSLSNSYDVPTKTRNVIFREQCGGGGGAGGQSSEFIILLVTNLFSSLT